MIGPNLHETEEAQESTTVSRVEARKYEAYERWYANRDGLFTALGKFVGSVGEHTADRISVGNVGLKPRSSVENLRNPVHRTVEFYATTMLTGPLNDALKIEEPDSQVEGEEPNTETPEKLKEAILKVWERSNMDSQKQVAKRYLARDGQLFEKVVLPEGKDYCYQQFLPAKDVTDFDTDERGNITYIRIDVPDVKVQENGQSRKIWLTEIWRKGENEEPGYAFFGESERRNPDTVPSEKSVRESGKRVELGTDSGYEFDFVPFVVVNAQDTGEKRPDPVYAHGLHLISWVCREATRLSDLMFRFNKAFKVIFGSGNDAQGRPLPPPKPGGVRDLGAMERESRAMAAGLHTVTMGDSRGSVLSRENEDISIEGIAVTGLPGTAQMADATPNINYEAARVWINDHMREIYEELPELLYYAIESRANQSGAALRTLIAGAISRAEEMQENLIAGLVKSDKMALTVSQLEGHEGFSEAEIGTYEDGGFDHTIEPPEILPLTEEEIQKAEAGKLTNARDLMGILSQLQVSPEAQRKVILTELGHEDLIEDAASAEDSEPEGNPTPDELRASQEALTARLNGQRTLAEAGDDSADG